MSAGRLLADNVQRVCCDIKKKLLEQFIQLEREGGGGWERERVGDRKRVRD